MVDIQVIMLTSGALIVGTATYFLIRLVGVMLGK